MAMRARAWLRGGFLALVLAIGAVQAPGHAAGQEGIDVTSVHAANLRVVSSSCRYVPITLRFTTGTAGGRASRYDVDFAADVEIWRRSEHVDTSYLWTSLSRTTATRARVSDDYVWCAFDGLGRFRAGPTRVSANTYESRLYQTVARARYRDTTSDTFLVRQGSRVSLQVHRVKHRRGVKGHHGKRHFTVKARYYSVGASSWRRWRGKPVTIQRWTGHRWRTVTRVRTNVRTGTRAVLLRAHAGQRFRAVVHPNSRTWGDHSPVRRLH